MSIDSGSEALPRKNRRTARRNAGADISPGLREHITQAAQKIRRAHSAELADVLKADRAGRLFRSIIHPSGKPAGLFTETLAVSAEGVGSLAGELGVLVGDAIRAGTGLLEGPLKVLAHEWMSTVMPPPAKPNLDASTAERPAPQDAAQPQPLAAPIAPGTTVEAAASGDAPGMAAAGPEEAKLRGVFRQFIPMVVNSLDRGGDGYGLAKTVITLFGRSTYDQASGLGKDKIMKIIDAEPDLRAQVAPIEAKFSKFLDEFTGYDAWTEEQARGGFKP